jgi:hypothetical protein
MPTRDELKEHFASLSVEELRGVPNSDDYTELAKEVAEEVLRARSTRVEVPEAPPLPVAERVPAIATDARCALHAGREATFVCTRCGAFRCQDCRGDEEGLCRPCEERKGESMEGLELGWLFRESAAVLVPSLPVVMGFGGVLGALGLAQSWLGTGAAVGGGAVSFVFVLATRAVALLGYLICIRLWAAIAQGASPTLVEAAAHALPRFGWALLLEAATFVAMVLAALACVVPALFLLVAWWLAMPALALGLSPRQSLSRSYALTYGHRWKLALALGVGVVPIVVLDVAWFGFSRWFPPGASRVFLAGGLAVLRHAFGAPLYALPTMAYLRLSGARLQA